MSEQWTDGDERTLAKALSLSETEAGWGLAALAPTVERIRREAKAQALREAARGLEGRLGTEGAPKTLWEFREHLYGLADRIEAGS